MPQKKRKDRNAALPWRSFGKFLPGIAALSIIIATAISSSRPPSPGNAATQFAPTLAGPHKLPIALPDLERGIHGAARYLNNASSANGQFEYRVNLNSSVKLSRKYNVLRHAGSVFALAEYERQFPSEPTRETLGRSIRFLVDETVGPVPGREGMLAVWSHPELSGSDGPIQAKLGGAGLTLVAILSARDVGVDEVSLDQLQQIGRFIRYLQKEDGSFFSKYIPSQGGRYDGWTSLYYPGEAALGLVMLYEVDPQPEWLIGATTTLGYLARIRNGKQQVEADHWALLATARLLPVLSAAGGTDEISTLRRHARQICNSILRQQPGHAVNSPLHGCFSLDGRTCPTATRLEGLLAARTFLDCNDESLRSRIDVAVHRGIAFLTRVQVPEGRFQGGIPRAWQPLPPRHPCFSPDFNRRATELRIDYAQHALSAMLEYRNWRNRDGQTP